MIRRARGAFQLRRHTCFWKPRWAVPRRIDLPGCSGRISDFGVVLILALATWAYLAAAVRGQEIQSENTDQHYVGSEQCTGCHQDATDAWMGSHHALAWTSPAPDTVLADFDGTRFEHDGVQYEFSVDNGNYRIHLTETDGTVKDYSVHSVVGVAPLQQYLIETEPGRLQSFDVVWDVENGRWYHLYPDQTLPPDDGLHWTGPYKNWNARCAECHATGFEKRYDERRQAYASVQVETGVGCEACHGPGSAHVDWAESAGTSSVPAPAGYGFAMDFAGAGAEAAIQQCATCHSRRESFGEGNPMPGTSFHEAYNLSLLRPGLYHADGQILDEVYVYGSFLQSRMYSKGVTCLNCHDAHSAELKADGNGVCTQCHSPAGNPDFTSLPLKPYDDPSHHFHEAGSEGAQCKNCHMIERVYMGTDGRRDHSFRIPRPDLADVTGAPDACTDCHADRSAEWAAAEIEKYHPNAAARPHYGVTLAAGRSDPVGAKPDLNSLALDDSQAGLVRATALWLLSQVADETTAEDMAPLLAHDDPLIRATAIAIQRAAPPRLQADRLNELLDDPERMVRIEAAKAMLDFPAAGLPEQEQDKLQQAMSEWRASLRARSDFPETHLVLGGMALTFRNIPAAKRAFREVVRMDPQREEAWVMLVRIAAAVDGREATLAILEEALSKVPDSQALNELRASVLAQ